MVVEMNEHEEQKELEQQTTAWLTWRRSRLGSSDAPIIMNLSPYSTPRQLWLEKTGKVIREQASNYAIEIGNKFEASARALYELMSDIDLPPTILVHREYPFLVASLDGYNEAEQVVLEIKCFSSKKNFEIVKAGKVPEWYYPQVQHQLIVSQAKEVHFFCCLVEKVGLNHQITEHALVVVKPDEAFQKELLIAELAFKQFINQNIAPPLSEADWLEADDQSTLALFNRVKNLKLLVDKKQDELINIKDELKQLELKFAELREEAIEHAECLGHKKISADGVRMQKSKDGVWSIRLRGDPK